MINESKAGELERNMGDLSTETKEESTVATKKKSAPKKKSSAKASGNGADHVTLAQLAKDFKLEPGKARRILRAAGIQRSGNKRWSWEKNSTALKKVETALTAGSASK